MIAETLAGIALVKSAVDGIKGAIGTANDIGDIASQIDSLFAGQKQVNEARNRKSGVSLVDQFGVENVARETIDAKIAAEKLQEVATMVDMRFGHGTWRGCGTHRPRAQGYQRGDFGNFGKVCNSKRHAAWRHDCF